MALTKKQLLLVILIYRMLKRRRQARTIQRQEWVNDLFRRRQQRGFFNNLIPELLHNERYNLKKFLRIDEPTFKHLVDLLKPRLQKFNPFRLPLTPQEKIAVTLRYLATGETYESLQFGFRMAANTICKVIPETCDAIIGLLGPIYLKTPNSAEEWNQIAEDFSICWNFPNCIGAIDGKHIAIKKPKHSGTDYYNYKGFYSIVLLGVVDANLKFIRAEVSINGRISDGGVWNRSEFKDAIENNRLEIPATKNEFPMLFVADDAFPLKPYLTKPYRAKNLSKEQLIFNYRLSRSRRVVENAFGILASRFQVLAKPMLIEPRHVKKVVLACCILHNLLRSQSSTARSYILNHVDDENVNTGQICEGSWRSEIINQLTGLEVNRTGNRAANEAYQIRERLCEYFNTNGAVPFQYNIFNN